MSTYIADYQILEKVDGGTHGERFLAIAPRRVQGFSGQVVMVKALIDNASDEDFRRVANELRLLHSVQSPHLVQVIDAGSDAGRLFFATPYYSAGDLGSAEPSLGDALSCVADAARGAHALHEHGVAHRDIKPQSIFIDGSSGRLGELALAELPPAQQTIGQGPIGSLGYMAPSLLVENKASRQSDIWSLGMTIHYVVAGQLAYRDFPERSLLEACQYLLRVEPAISERLDTKLASIVSRALMIGENEPFVTAQELADQLDVYVASTFFGAT